MRFSVITVCLNPGEKLKATLESVLRQSCKDAELIVKDGCSTDGSVEKWQQEHAKDPGAERVRVYVEKDKGIYDAMNQAVAYAKGEFLLFLNCGDVLSDDSVLERLAHSLEKEREAGTDMDRLVLYGDTCSIKNNVTIASPPSITGFTCYRNIPCHQSCLYSAALCREKPYDLQYKIRADYDHFLWCYYRAGAKMLHVEFPVASYEGGGYSENRANRQRDGQEHRQITAAYMSRAELLRYRTILACTLAPLRRAMAESRMFSGIYHWMKERVYQRRIWFLAAALLFLLEMGLLIWPVGWLGEEQISNLTGEGAWALELPADNPEGYCQEFVPQYSKLKSIGVVVAEAEAWPAKGNMSVRIADSKNETVFEDVISYDEIWTGSYMDIETGLVLKRGARYRLFVDFESDDSESVPALMVYGSDYSMPENVRLLQTEEEGVQLLTRYIYEDAIAADKMLRVILLCILAAAGMAFGLPQKAWLRESAGIALIIFMPYILGRRLEMLSINRTLLLPFSMKWNMGLMYLFELILLLCTQSFRFTICLSNILLTLIYSANYFVKSFRGTPLRLSDLTAIGTAAKVAGGYTFRPDSHVAMAWCIAVLFVVCGMQTGSIRQKSRKAVKKVICHAVTFIMAVIVAGTSGYLFLDTDILVRNGFMDIKGFYQDMNYDYDGYLVASLINIQNSRIRKPDGYSVEKVRELLNREESEDNIFNESMPHIILVMNESFADLRVLGNLQLNEENLPFFNNMRENTIRGYVNASVLGGGTANSEFEVFTGCSMGFLPISTYAYQQYITKDIPSLISYVKENGYTTYSIHPAQASNWNRDRIYEHLGFEHCLWNTDFQDAERIHFGVSDAGTYEKVEELFEEREPGERMFIFDLTIQNHGGYFSTYDWQDIAASNVRSDEADTYLSLIKKSDEAFESLITYFKEVEEPVMVCMFGDHQPKLEDDFYEAVYSQTEGLSEIDKRLNMYKTPFLIWANYDIPEQEGLDISMNYLGVLLADVAGLPGSPYFSFLKNYMEEYPVITVNGYRDKEGNYYDWSGDDAELSDYRMLQYNYLFDENFIFTNE